MSETLADEELPPLRSRLNAEELKQAEQARKGAGQKRLTIPGGAVSRAWTIGSLTAQLRCGDLGLGVRDLERVSVSPCLLFDETVRPLASSGSDDREYSRWVHLLRRLQGTQLTPHSQSWISALSAGGFSGWFVAFPRVDG